jgi:hypothetical protein
MGYMFCNRSADNGLHVLQQVGSFFNDFRGGLSSAPKTKYVGVQTVSYGRKFKVTPEGLGLWKHHTVCVCVYVCVCVCLCVENARDRSEYGSIFSPSQTVP